MQKHIKMELNKKQTEKQKEILEKVPVKTSGIIYVAQRVGKTKIAIDLIKRDKHEKILWVVPSAIVVEKNLKEDFKKFKAEKYYKNVTAVTWASLHKTVGSYDLIILDEIHFITPRNSQKLRQKTLNASVIFGMSGTKTKTLSKNFILSQQLKLPIFVDYTIKEAVKDEILSAYKVRKVPISLGIEKDHLIETRTKSFFVSEVSNYEYLSGQIEKNLDLLGKPTKQSMFFSFIRKGFLSGIKGKRAFIKNFILSHKEERTLVFVSTQKLAERFSSHYHSKSSDKHLKAFENEKKNFLVLVNKGGTGYTFHNVDNVIITQADTDTNGNVVQKIMRGMIKDSENLNIYITYAEDTRDEFWVEAVLKNF